MRRALLAALPALLAAALWAPVARGAGAAECLREADPVFGICALEAAFEPQPADLALQAGSHPQAVAVELAVNTEAIPEGVGGAEEVIPSEEVRDLRIALPEGLVGSPTAVPRCPSAKFILGGTNTECPTATALGKARIEFQEVGYTGNVPVYNLAPAPGVAVKLGFVVEQVAPVTVDVRLSPQPPHNAITEVTNVTQVRYFFDAITTVWGDPTDPSHDPERGRCLNSKESCGVSIPERAFLTLPTACEGPLKTGAEADSWQDPGDWAKAATETEEGVSGCAKLPFDPEVSSRPTTDRAAAPTGLRFGIDVDDPNLLAPDGYAASQVKETEVTLPEGITLNPSAAEGLGVCGPARYAAEALDAAPGEGCPSAAKVGEVEVETPLLEGTIAKGSVYVAEPYRNPFGSLLALYIAIAEPERGIFVKLAGLVEPDPETGRLTTTVKDVPQLPFSHFRFRFKEGPRAPLIAPNACGTYATEVAFVPWSDPSSRLHVSDSFQISSGVDGGPCPRGPVPPFSPGFAAGALNATAGEYAPFFARLTRRDGDQDMTKLSFVMPEGLTGKIAGLTRCSEAAIAAARAKSGSEELDSPSCPPNSRIGRVLGGAGVGSQLTYVDGGLYLAGPIGTAPLSIVSIVPAVAGPFDVGTIVTRVALKLNPVTAQVEVDGANSEPLPHILAGIPLRVRDVRLHTDRPDFTLNPTDCSPQRIGGYLWGGGAQLFSDADDRPVFLAVPFAAVNCARLGFKPRLRLALKGPTRRGGHPALKAVLTPRAKDANFARAAVTLPRSAFLDQAHIRTICTRVQFAAPPGNGAHCPAGARYGYVRVWTPILDHPAQGPVFLRSSDHKLPDLVFALQGPPEAAAKVELSARIDSKRGGIRTSFATIPDFPASRLVLTMQGGKKGLIVNSTELCKRPRRARVALRAQNNRRYRTGPKLTPTGCKRARR